MFQVLWLADTNLVRLVGRTPTYLSAITCAELDADVPFLEWGVGTNGRLFSPPTVREEESGRYLIAEACEHCGSIEGWAVETGRALRVYCIRCKR